MEDIKDSIANGTTIAAAGSVIIDWSEVLTIGLLITGMILNIARIIEIRNKTKKQD